MRPSVLRAGWLTAYATAVLLFLALVGRYWHPVYGFTAFFQLDGAEARVMLAPLRERPVFVYRDTGGYDGMFYAQLATSPLLTDPGLPRAMDNFSYRARRILGSWVAWAIALGDRERALDVYALINPLCWLALAWLLLRWFPPGSVHNFVAWAGVLFSAGVLTSVRLALTDLPAGLLVAVAIAALERTRPKTALACLAAAALARDTSLLVATAVPRNKTVRAIAPLAFAVAPLALWYVYVRHVAGPAAMGWGNFGVPGVGFAEKWRATLSDFGNRAYPLVPWFTLAALIGLTVQAAWLLLRRELASIWWRLGATYTGLMLVLGAAPWEGYPGAATRVLLPLQLAFNVLAPRTRAGLALLLVGNLGVLAGVDELLNRLPDPHELAAAKVDGATLFARTGAGFFAVERHGRHVWSWSSGTATLHLKGWHEAPNRNVRVTFALVAFTPQTVTVSHAGHSVWSGRLEQNRVEVSVDLGPLSTAGTDLQFTTDAPARRENTAADARALTFSVGDLRFTHAEAKESRR